MKSPLKELAKALPHPIMMRLFQSRYLHRQGVIAEEIARFTGLPDANVLDLGRYKKSDTVFILGSGPSINEISERHWAMIKRNDTIGFNLWPAHAFVPGIFIFESIVEARHKVLFDTFLALLNSRAEAYTETLKIITELKRPGVRQLVTELDPALHRNLYLGYTAPIPARNERELRMGLNYLSSRGHFRPTNKVGLLFKYGGSVTAMISLALKMNYRRIVLCGVDLGDQKYFYQDADLYPASAKWEFAPKGNIHLTARRLPWMVPAQQVVYEMKRVIIDPLGVELFVENSSSTLYPFVPVIPNQFFN